MQRKTSKGIALVWSAFLVLTLLLCSQAGAQVTTASIGGTVADKTGPLPGATVSAKNVQTAFVFKTTAGENGSFNLNGLPPGTYEITVASEAYKPQTQTVTVLLGQQNKVRFELSPEKMFMAETTVVGETTKLLVDTRSSAVTTNITPQQIESLPQNNRNFLNFAQLAPGIQTTADTDAAGQYFTGGGANPKQVNVFIDGLSQKNDIIQGGAFMQDSAKGNPFPQNAVQEYQVLTQNYKAEYEKAASAVITAVTKSGGNDLHGEAFYLFQNDSMVTQDEFAAARGDAKPPYKRQQGGVSLGGPIMKDKLHFFVSWEGRDQPGEASVYHGSQWSQAPANLLAKLSTYTTGTQTAPFKENLYFGKISWQPAVSDTLDVSYSNRDEKDVRGFGGTRTYDGAENFQDKTQAAVAKYQKVLGNSTFNDASLTWQKFQWISGAVNPGVPHENYVNLLDVGSKDYIQNLQQERTGIRDALSYFTEWHGSHSLKFGVVATQAKYDMIKDAYYNPYFEYRSDENWQYPWMARYGYGQPALKFNNTQYGLFAQDDWAVTSNFTVNVGLRWDYETNMLDNNWVTPAAIVNGLKTSCRTYSQPVGGKTTWCFPDIFNPDDYISTGSNRKSYKSMYQPRIGFSWDVNQDGKTVVFGGWGMYYDRVALNDIYDEAYKNQWFQYQFCFTNDPTKVGTALTGCSVPAILWDPKYLQSGGLASVIASGQAAGPEVNLVANNTHPPRSTQYTLGVRQQIGDWLGSFTYAVSNGYNGLVWSFGTNPPGTSFNDRWGNGVSIPGYGFIMRSYDTRTTEYTGYFLTMDKPYTADSKWGANFAYTHSDSKWNASNDTGTAFAFDTYPPPFFGGMFPGKLAPRDAVIMSGIVGLPAGFRVSSIISLTSGLPYDQANAYPDWGNFHYYYNAIQPSKYGFLGIKQWAYRSVDLRVDWTAKVGGMNLGLSLEGFNIFNYSNYTYDPWTSGFVPPQTDPANAKYGKPTSAYNTRRYQLGLRFSF
jgi:outer membrane receptor protein involved in Fe transport